MKEIFSRKIILFYILTIVFSWSLFLITDAWLMPKFANSNFLLLVALYGHMLAMFGPMLAGIVILKFFQKSNLLPLIPTKKKYYLYVIYAVLIIWIIPAFLFLLLDEKLTLKMVLNNYEIIFVVTYVVFGLFAGIGEEYGWSGYILSELSKTVSKSKSVIISGILRGLWHMPVLLIPVILSVSAGEKSFIELFILTIIFAIQLIVSNIFMSALFGYVWFKTSNLFLLGWMHFLLDIARDFALLFIVGFGSSFWFKFGWGIPFYFFAYLAFMKISKEDGYSNYLEIFYKKSYCQ